MEKIYLQMIIKLIRKYFKEGVDVITDYDGEVIAYRRAWSKDLDEDFKSIGGEKVDKDARKQIPGLRML